MRKTYKKIISLCAVLIFALALIPVSAFADPFTAVAVGGLGGASGAGLFSSMASASGISIDYPSGISSDPCDALWNDLNSDNVYFSGEKGQETITDPETGIPTVYDYISVDISDWLQAQTDFIDEFVSNYQVTDNSSGNFSVTSSYAGYEFHTAISMGYYRGDSLGPILRNGSYSIGAFTISFTYTSFLQANIYLNGTLMTTKSLNDSHIGLPLYFCNYGGNSDNYRFFDFYNNSWSTIGNGVTATSVSPSYNGSWTSSIVNTGVFDGYTAAKVMIPASSWNPSDPVNWSIQELLKELTDKWISGTESDIIIEDDQGPVPPPVPVPTTPLGNIPTDEWYDLFGLPVLEGQEEIHQDLQDFSDQVESGLDDVIGELEDIESDVESIDTNLGIGNGLLGDLKSIGQSIQNTLSSILSGVTDLVQEIVLSTETFIAGLLNSIMGGFGGMFSTMREAFSIWHYVVEWVGSISTVFSWFWSVAGSTSYYIQLPIYASLAGAVVLAFYKRFGK